MQPDCSCSKPTSRGQSAGVHPVLQFPNLPPLDCRPGDYRLFIKLRTYLQGTARVWCILFLRFLNRPAGNCLHGWSLFIWFLNLPPGDCQQGMQLVLLVPNLHPGDCHFGGGGGHSFFTFSYPSSRGPLDGG